jgi:1-acyl-sn-glycerol-3-phosphate acyltransferase
VIKAKHNRALLTAFRRYNRAYMKSNFSRVLLAGSLQALKGSPDVPLIVCISHSSWWDLLTGILLEEASGRCSITAMDERQLKRYRFFSWMGVAGVDRTTIRGAREFTEYCREFLGRRSASLWLTPQGEMVDPRQRPIRCQPGVGYLIQQIQCADVVTIAVEYAFWTDKSPVALISISEPQRMNVAAAHSRRKIVADIEHRMEEQADQLAELATSRNEAHFTVLLKGRQGIQPVYDLARRIGTLIFGKRSAARHGDLETPRWRDNARGNQI